VQYEVELKFRLDDPRAVIAVLNRQGAEQSETVEQTDVYFNHPCRDFAETREAFRIRTESDRLFVNYKGPVLDTQTKMREEIEFPIGETATDLPVVRGMLSKLGFREVGAVSKHRTSYEVAHEGKHLTVTIDVVQDVGNYLEIEMLADEDGRNPAREAILSFARQLGLHDFERRSYLVMLLANRAAAVASQD